MSDLSAAERIAAEALDFLALSLSDTRAGARLVVAALVVAGWLVEPVPPLLSIDTETGRVDPVDDLRQALADERALSERLRDQVVEQAAAIEQLLAEQDGPVSPIPPAPAPPASSP